MSVTNDKWRCLAGCGGIFHFDNSTDLRPCPSCGVINYEQIVMHKLCDFCGTNEDVAWVFPCAPFEVDHGDLAPNQRSEGGWGACSPCKEDVLRNARLDLARRAAEVAIVKEPEMRAIEDILIEEISVLHGLFFANRNGDPVPDTEEVPH